MNLIFFLPVIVIVIFIVVWYIYDSQGQKKQIVQLSKLDALAIIDQQKDVKNKSADEKDDKEFYFKLIQAGLTKKEYNEGKFVIALIGIILGIAIPVIMKATLLSVIIGVLIAIIAIFFGGKIYIYISKNERAEKINNDLGVFLDLINVILEAGGGLKNAFFTVSTRAHGILDEELLKEIAILEYEMTNYTTKKAYENLKKRVDSDDLGKIVDFLILSEEAGIGVKNIFSTQSDEMRQEKFYKIKGKVNTLNMYLILVLFVFVLPALGAFIVFPMMAGQLELGLGM
ncbi:type II secretion system F family protein [Halarcobacter sp.]|uniref:type II secretion system F family protein n=1 Tax=Halarcobacter sp. TaxID=2321133 RepID=UPI0029F54513|nr:type II secretion system F family protein [Halarcobacter sp.]